MVAETDDIKAFLIDYPPFDALEPELLDMAVRNLTISFKKSGEVIDFNETGMCLIIIRTGSIEVRLADGTLADRLSTGGFLGYMALLANEVTDRSIRVLEDSLLYELNETTFHALRNKCSNFDLFFTREHNRQLREFIRPQDQNLQLNLPVSELMVKTPVCAPANLSIREAAELMTQRRVSSLLILQDEELVGIVTDRDLRSRVIAKGIGTDNPLGEIMTANPASIEATRSVHDAQLAMMSANIHHLPVVKGKRPVGMIALNDFIRANNSEPVFLIQAVNRATQREDIYRVARDLPELIHKLIKADTRADEVGRIITSVTDSMTRKLLSLAREEFGEPPCDFAWLAFGSQGRQEQMLGSDQDNALLISDEMKPEDDAYFSTFARFVNDGLDRCGLRYCPGEIMAMTDKWRQPLGVWKSYYSSWIEEPEPKALMHSSIFFDMRHVEGNPELTAELHSFILNKARNNTIFLALMSDNSMTHSPPLGFFKTFVLEKDGDHNPILDLKPRGTIPIVDIARNYSLACGIAKINTLERLAEIADQGALSRQMVANLVDAYEFIAGIRLESQGRQFSAGREVNNHVDPNQLSPLVRHQLKDAFSVVREGQQAMKTRFGSGAI